MARVVAPLSPLKTEEMEVSKNEGAFYLDLYFKFIKEVMKSPTESYINIFKRIRYGDKLNIINNATCLNEYDYMIQYVEFFTISKFFSVIVENNIDYLDEIIANGNIDDKYYVEGSTKYSKKDIIKFIRNALNHNDKSTFELFRLIKSNDDIDLYLEIYLRRLNMHLKIKVKDLYDLFGEILDSNSIYDYSFIDKNGNSLLNIEDIERELDNGIKLKLSHLYNFELDENKNIRDSSNCDKFEKIIPLRNSQVMATKETMKQFCELYGDYSKCVLPYVLRDNIPFGMAKTYGYGFDINFFIRDLYNPNSSYREFCTYVNSLEYDRKEDETNSLYYSVVNPESVVDRSFSLLASHVLDSIIPENNPMFELNGETVNKKHYRDAFVHSRWFSYVDESLKKKLSLSDYCHGDSNIMVSSIPNQEEIIINQEDLYNSLKNYFTEDNYDLPISLILDESGNGYHITYRKDGVNYYCNASLTKDSPIFLLLGEKDGNVFVADQGNIKEFSKLIGQLNLDNIDPRMAKFIRRVPNTAMEAFMVFSFSNPNSYYRLLSNHINELVDICTETKLGISSDTDIKHFHY